MELPAVCVYEMWRLCLVSNIFCSWWLAFNLESATGWKFSLEALSEYINASCISARSSLIQAVCPELHFYNKLI